MIFRITTSKLEIFTDKNDQEYLIQKRVIALMTGEKSNKTEIDIPILEYIAKYPRTSKIYNI